jgi:hypothetical protein
MSRAALDAIIDDVRYFRANPDAKERTRAAFAGETFGDGFDLTPPREGAELLVCVKRCAGYTRLVTPLRWELGSVIFFPSRAVAAEARDEQ